LVQARDELTQRIAELQAQPPNEDRRIALRRLRLELLRTERQIKALSQT
jgi:hypothetical protein